MRWYYATGGALLLCITAGAQWIRSAPPVPASLGLDRIVPGRTTVADIERMWVASRKWHFCTGSVIEIVIPRRDWWDSAELVVEASYHGPNDGYRSPGGLNDGDCKIRKVEVLRCHVLMSSGAAEWYPAWFVQLLQNA